jgi:hypothetical protein
MKIATWTVAGGCAVALAAIAAAVFGGCSNAWIPPPPPSGVNAGGLPCVGEAGVFPAPNCDNTDESCSPPASACPTSPCNASSACLAMADNGGKTTQDFRIRKLNVTAPPALALQFIQQGVIDQGINLKNYCGEGGDGSFSWLIRLDTTNNQVTTGGAPPTTDPFHTGYCFVNAGISGLPVKPVTINVTKQSDGSYTSDVIDKLYVPIYIQGDPNNVVVLPLSKSKVQGVTVSTDGNCIGSYNPTGVGAPDPTGVCLDQDPSSCQRWHTAGSLGGFITLNEADGVNVVTLGKSLCVLLTQGSSTTNAGKNCAKDANGNVTAKGDFCSTTDSPGGCQDSSWLAATFAASAALITDGSSVAACNGSIQGGGDGGTDGSPSEGGATDGGTNDGGGTDAAGD